ncbi:MAG: CoB--CoM heterodisulfide reductase iron-sulfur subunit A family protein, partial [Clostridiales bacterium]|nr:CoB--CoM heterodisulfide reductase iron-sulfur subunit A family protein [Clostridiales bacterium]
MQRIGVFVCHCGTNIAATVDVKKVVELVRYEPGVVFADDYMYMCSEAGQEKIIEAIKEHGLTGLVICSCSPRMHEKTFRACAEKAGLNPYMVEIANIREQCSWIDKDREEATEKAVILARAAIAKVNLNTPLKEGESPVTKRALVIGGGIAGIQTALDIADAGYEVDIVEREPSIGGRMSQFDKTFPTLDCASCILTPKMVEVNQHPNITLYTYSEVEGVSGYVGNFDVKIRKKARSVDMAACTGCGECQAKCPLGKLGKIPSEFDRGLRNRPAIYMPFAQAVPAVPVIDRENCTYFKTGKCGVCAKICPSKAVNYEQEDEIVTVKYGAIVVATGFDIINLDKFGEYAYNECPDVITSIELERLMNASGPTGGHLERMSDHKQPKDIVFIQCVGSRCDDERGKPYCSKVCCMYTAKHAMLIKDHWPDTNITVFYIDVRTPGKNFDEFYRRAVEQYHVNYVKGQVGKVIPQPDGSIVVQAVDMLDNKQIMKKTDMVVLAAAIEPNKGVRKIATMLTASIDNNDFLTEAHAKLRPVESPTAGIFLSGMAQGPKDIPETVSQAGAAAVKVVGLLAKDKL